MPNLKINIEEGVIEVEGDEKLVREIYNDFKNTLIEGHSLKEASVSKTGQKKKTRKNDKGAEAGKQKKTRGRKKESYTIIKDLDLTGKSGKQSLKDFYKEKGPSSYMEKSAVFIYYLAKLTKIKGITINHVYTCYKNVQAKVPSLRQNLLDTSHRKGWIDTKKMDDMIITTHGENLVEQELPKGK